MRRTLRGEAKTLNESTIHFGIFLWAFLFGFWLSRMKDCFSGLSLRTPPLRLLRRCQSQTYTLIRTNMYQIN